MSELQNTTATANPKREGTKLAPDKLATLATFGNGGVRFLAPGLPSGSGGPDEHEDAWNFPGQQDLSPVCGSGLDGRW